MMLDPKKVALALSFWMTRVNAKFLANVLGINRETVGQVVVVPAFRPREGDGQMINYGRETMDGNERRRGWTALEKPDRHSIDDFISLVLATRAFGRSDRNVFGMNVEDVVDTRETANLRKLVSATSCLEAVVGTYQFRGGERQVRFTPNVMVRTSDRIHFRGFLEVWVDGEWSSGHEGGFRDIIPGRFTTEPEVVGWCRQGPMRDVDWETFVDIRFRPHPELPLDRRRVLELEFDIDHDTRPYHVVRCRRALALYYTRLYEGRRIGPKNYRAWQKVE